MLAKDIPRYNYKTRARINLLLKTICRSTQYLSFIYEMKTKKKKSIQTRYTVIMMMMIVIILWVLLIWILFMQSKSMISVSITTAPEPPRFPFGWFIFKQQTEKKKLKWNKKCYQSQNSCSFKHIWLFFLLKTATRSPNYRKQFFPNIVAEKRNCCDHQKSTWRA